MTDVVSTYQSDQIGQNFAIWAIFFGIGRKLSPKFAYLIRLQLATLMLTEISKETLKTPLNSS
jgi:hypothetical protein